VAALWQHELRFAVVGDTRPANIDDTSNYPVAIISKIYQDVEAESPHPQFVVATGDYMFASTTSHEQTPQLAKYMTAHSQLSGPLYPATTGMNYGYVIVARNADGTLTVTAYDYMTHAVLQTFSIQASGAAA
jgi:hypothetical protein